MGREARKRARKSIIQQETMRQFRVRSGINLQTDTKMSTTGATLSGKIKDLTPPVALEDLSNKAYVDTKIADTTGAVLNTHFADETKGGGDSSYRLRKIGAGSGPEAAGTTHNHSSVNFNVDYTDQQRRETINMRAATEQLLENLPQNLSPLRPAIELILDLAHQLIDHPEMRAEEFQDKFENNSVFRHHYLMASDAAYKAAYHFKHDPHIREESKHDDRVMRLVKRGHEKYTQDLGEQ